MKNPLPKLLSIFTGARYIPEIQWSSKSWTHNVFRAWELVFGRKYGIRCEVTADSDGNYKFYTVEARIAHFEGLVRRMLAGIYPFHTKYPELAWQKGAIAFDAVGHQTTASASPSATFTISGSDRILIAFPYVGPGTPSISSCTWNSVGLTFLQTQTGNGLNQTFTYYQFAPSTGSNSLVANASSGSDARIMGASYTGVNQSALDGNGVTNQNNTTSYSPTAFTTTANNCWTVWAIENNSGDANSITTGNVRTSSGTGRGLYDIGPQTPAGSSGVTGVTGSGFGATTDWWASVVSIAPAASGPANLKTLNGIAKANIKTINGVAIASVKTYDGIV